jgi:PAS domain S-box-containing protein
MLSQQMENLKAEVSRLRQCENENVYRSLFENNHAVMLLIDPQTAEIRDANPAACAYYGWSREQLKNTRIDEINTLTRDEIFAQMQLARTEKRRNFFFKHRRADGSVRDVEVYSGPLTVKGQTLLYSIIHDITERRQIEDAHRQSEEKFRLAFQTSPDSINFNRLSDGMYIDINEGFTKLTGYTREDAIGKSSIDLNIWYDPKDRQRLFKKLQKDGYVENLEARFRKKDGQVGVGLMSASVLNLNQEDVILSITRDITERKQFADALRESEDKYTQLVESLTDAILVWSGEEVTYANPAAIKLFKVKQPADLIGKRYLDLVHPDDRPESAERIKKSKNERWIAPRREHRIIAADGQIIYVESTGVPIQVKGRILHLGIFSDISKRKRAEEKLRESEERMRIAIEAAKIGTYMTDLEADKVHWSPELCDILGVQRGMEITNEEAYKVVHNEDIERVLEIGRRGLDPNGDGAFYSEHRVVRPDGHVRWILWRGRTLFRDTESGRVPSKRIGACVDITDRVQAQELLAESERRLSTLMANLPGMAYRCLDDDFWTMQFVSDGCLDLTGFPADHLLENRRKSYAELIHADDLKMVREQVDSSLQRRSPFNLTYRIITAGGEEKWVLEKGQGVFSGSGELLAIEGFITDITERKQAETALRESEERHRQIVESSTDAILVRSGESVVYANPAAIKLFRANHANELIGKRYLDLVHPDDRDVSAERIRKGKSENWIAPPRQHRILTLDGKSVYVESTGVPIRYQGDTQLFGVFRDVTERKRAEEALRENEETFNAFMEHCPVYVFFKDENIRPIRLSRNYEQMLGRPIEEVLGKTMDELFPAELAKGMIADDLSVLNGGRSVKVVEDLNGRTFETTKFPIQQVGKPPMLAGFTIDITESRQADQQREKLEAQLRQAQKMEAIGSLAGGIAHDFNNILSVIIGNAEILRMTDISFSGKDEVDQILAASKRARDLVRQILAFSRQGEQKKILMNLKPVVKETIEFLRASIPSMIQLQHYIRPDAGAIMADPTQMQQILMNLSTNAAHAMEKDGGVLRIELDNIQLSEKDDMMDSEAEPGHYIRITVSDTGHGIAPEMLARIFDPYFTTKGPDKGTGLGLSVVHGIVRSHGGIVKVYSEVGKGTAFHVFLPRTDGAVKKEEKVEQKLPIGTERILVVDDEMHLLEMYQRMLGLLGYRVDTRSSPIEAIEALRSNPMKYDLVLTDMTMPQMNGHNLAKKIMEIRPGLPVILCTGFSDQINEEKARSAGILGFLLKPVLFHDLANTLRKALDDSSKKRSPLNKKNS